MDSDISRAKAQRRQEKRDETFRREGKIYFASFDSVPHDGLRPSLCAFAPWREIFRLWISSSLADLPPRCCKTTTPSSHFDTRAPYSALPEKSLSAIILNEFKPNMRCDSTIQLVFRLRYGDHIAYACSRQHNFVGGNTISAPGNS